MTDFVFEVEKTGGDYNSIGAAESDTDNDMTGDTVTININRDGAASTTEWAESLFLGDSTNTSPTEFRTFTGAPGAKGS